MHLTPHALTFRQLQYVVAVAERESFGKAAHACGVSQPSLSTQVAQLEDTLGVRLFERDKRHVRVTAAGEVLVQQAREILARTDALVEEARGLADPRTGTLRLGAIPTVAPYLLPEVAPVLRARFPKLAVLWSEDKTAALVEALRHGELDGAIVALESDLGTLPHVVLGTDTFVLATPPGHRLAASKKPLDAGALAGEEVLLLDDGHCFRDQALAVCDETHASVSDYRATSISTLVQMAAGGLGVTLLPTLALDVENRRDALRTRRFAPEAPHRTLALAWRPGSARERTLRPVGAALHDAYVALARRHAR